jgi:hypothetical protein
MYQATMMDMTPSLLSFVRIMYTVTLFFSFLAISSFYYFRFIASSHGHGSLVSPNDLIVAALFFSLLISRLLCERDARWLLLGLPTILALCGFFGYFFF